MAGKEQSAVYLIRNLVNQKVYVGASKDSKARMSRHRKYLKRNQHKNPALQEDWNIHGRMNFDFSILELAPPEKLLERESYWMKFYGSLDIEKGYNYWISDNSITPRDKKVSKPRIISLYKTYVCIVVSSGEVLRLSSPEIKEKFGVERGAVSKTSSYWRGNLKATKTCHGVIFVSETEYKEDFDYIGFDKLKFGRLPISCYIKKNKVISEPKPLINNNKKILMKSCVTGEETEINSIREAIRTYNLTNTKLQKCLKAPFSKYKHHNCYFKYL